MDDLKRDRNPQPERSSGDYRLKSTGPSMPSSDVPLSRTVKGSKFMKKITVIIPSYNNRESCERNLSSVVAQDYHDFRVIYVDDCFQIGQGIWWSSL